MRWGRGRAVERWEVLRLYDMVAEMGRKRLSHNDVIMHIYGQEDMLRRLIGRLPMRLPTIMNEEDLMQEAIFTISRALRAYEPYRGDLGLYLKRAVRRGVRDWFRECDSLSRRRSQQGRELMGTYANLEQRNHRSPRDEDLAAETGWSVDVVGRVLEAMSSRIILSWEHLPEQVREKTDDCDPFDQACARHCSRRLSQAVRQLSLEERRVVELHYSADVSLRELAARTDTSPSQVRRLHNRALAKLRAVMA